MDEKYGPSFLEKDEDLKLDPKAFAEGSRPILNFDNEKLYFIQYSIGARTVGVAHYVAMNPESAIDQFNRANIGAHKGNLFLKAGMLSVAEVELPDYNLNLERKLKGDS